jgi:hypothetical protein
MTAAYDFAHAYWSQGGHPIPVWPGVKEPPALKKGTRPHYERRQPTARELARWWPPGSDRNIALLLGPTCRLLAVNINVKHGLDGFAALRGFPSLPDTPTIMTPSGGVCLFFRVPDRERYPFPFKTHQDTGIWPKDAIELRGAGGYQLVPVSILLPKAEQPGGEYQFAEGWTAD